MDELSPQEATASDLPAIRRVLAAAYEAHLEALPGLPDVTALSASIKGIILQNGVCGT